MAPKERLCTDLLTAIDLFVRINLNFVVRAHKKAGRIRPLVWLLTGFEHK